MFTEKQLIRPEERAKATQKIIEQAKENCNKYNEIMTAHNELRILIDSEKKEEIIAIGTDFLIKQI